MNEIYNVNNLIEIKLKDHDGFLKIMETLTRIGVPIFRNKNLYQLCHILHKKGKYYIVHYKEMQLLDGIPDTEFDVRDVNRRNSIIQLLYQWGLCKPVDVNFFDKKLPKSKMMIVPYKDKHKWNLKANYNIGSYE